MRARFGGNIVPGVGYARTGPEPVPAVAFVKESSMPVGTAPTFTTRLPGGGLVGPPPPSIMMRGGMMVGPASVIRFAASGDPESTIESPPAGPPLAREPEPLPQAAKSADAITPPTSRRFIRRRHVPTPAS